MLPHGTVGEAVRGGALAVDGAVCLVVDPQGLLVVAPEAGQAEGRAVTFTWWVPARPLLGRERPVPPPAWICSLARCCAHG